jgi:hypothetical protein
MASLIAVKDKSATDNTATTAVVNSVVKFLNGMKNINQNVWTGTMTSLDKNLRRVMGKSLPENWPGSPSALRVVLNKSINRLRNRKIRVQFERSSDRSRTRIVQITNS